MLHKLPALQAVFINKGEPLFAGGMSPDRQIGYEACAIRR